MQLFLIITTALTMVGAYSYMVQEKESKINNYSQSIINALPNRIDWREKNATPVVKDQGNVCNAGAYFATISLVESQLIISKGMRANLSAQNIADCSWGFGNNYCRGGTIENSLEYIIDSGIPTEEYYPYNGNSNQCQEFDRQTLYGADMGYTVIPNSEEELQKAVATVGPVAVTIDGHNLTRYTGGVFSDPSCRPHIGTHSALVVGYDTTNDGTDYWILQFSYSTDFGEDGYVRLARNAGNMCGIAYNAVYVILK